MIDTAFLGIAELGRAYRERTLTPAEAVEQALDRLARWEPRLNAFAHVMADCARSDATRLGQELADGHDRGPLHGIPIAVKDLIEIEGEPTGFGSKVRPPVIATRDALLVVRLRQAGAIIIGKTNLLEYAYGVAHPEVGQTNNPYDPHRTSGGSSGGSAAAVAAGIVPLGIGTDTGGSIRIPASYCGIVGLKPTYGLVPLDGVFPLSWSLDHAGPLTGSVADAATTLAVLAGMPIPFAPPAEAHGLRIGLIRKHWASEEITPEVRATLDAALSAFRDVGARLVEVDVPHLHQGNVALGTILRPEATLAHEELLPLNPAGYAPQTLAQLESGRTILATEYVRAKRFADDMRATVEAQFASVDLLLSPAVPFVAPFTDPVIEEGEEGEMLSSGLANLTGHPALNLPAGLAEGLPIGLQLIGAHGQDSRLLSLAAALEAVLGVDDRPRGP